MPALGSTLNLVRLLSFSHVQTWLFFRGSFMFIPTRTRCSTFFLRWWNPLMLTAFLASFSLDNEFVSATLMKFAFRDDDCTLIYLCSDENLTQVTRKLSSVFLCDRCFALLYKGKKTNKDRESTERCFDHKVEVMKLCKSVDFKFMLSSAVSLKRGKFRWRIKIKHEIIISSIKSVFPHSSYSCKVYTLSRLCIFLGWLELRWKKASITLEIFKFEYNN